MLQIDISSDIDAAFKDVNKFWWREVPFATAGAINNTAFDVRKRVTESTWKKAFTVRNRVFPGRLFRVLPKATKRSLEATVAQVVVDKGYDRMVESQATGGKRKKRGGNRIAIPARPDNFRSPTGRIRKPLKPRSLQGKRGVYKVDKGAKSYILRRRKKGAKPELMYTIVQSANIPKRFKFFEDAQRTTLRVFSAHWNSTIDRSIRSSRFFPG